jgi:thioredoxin-like negative regulator of GroEL
MTNEQREKIQQRLQLLLRKARDALTAGRYAECFVATREVTELQELLEQQPGVAGRTGV